MLQPTLLAIFQRRRFAGAMALCLAFVSGCGTKTPLPKEEEVTSTPINAGISGTLLPKKKPDWRVKVTKLGQVDLTATFALNSSLVWVGGHNALYRSDDGGETWKALTVQFPPQTQVGDIYFSTPLRGWAIIQKRISGFEGESLDTSWLMRTDDGGSTWQEVLEQPAAILNRITFNDDRNGWVGGLDFGRPGSYQSQGVMLVTHDGGEQWSDISAILNIKFEANDGVMDMIANDERSAVVLSANGKLFRTTDGGKSWTEIARIHDERQQTGYRRLRLSAGKYWALGSALSEEGTWSSFSALLADSSSWGAELPGVFFADALVLGEQEIIGVGQTFDPSIVHNPGRLGVAVVLASADKGRTWSFVRKKLGGEDINAIAPLGPAKAIAIGDRGLVLMFEK
jgi:photosystem II stability/assembly factor-like uncharacterized protein